MEYPGEIGVAARRLRIGALIGLGLVGAVCVYAIVVTLSASASEGPVRFITGAEPLAPWADVAVLALTGIPTILALWHLVRMLRDVERGEVFTRATIGELRAFALFVLIGALASMLAPPLLAIATAALDGAERSEVTMTFDSADLFILLVSLLLFFVARLLGEAQRIADEHRQIV
jgi:hypothetical protein